MTTPSPNSSSATSSDPLSDNSVAFPKTSVGFVTEADIISLGAISDVASQAPTFWSGLKAAVGFAGAGILIAVGYFDPGNWATDLAAGASFKYALLSVILFSNILAVVLQSLCVKLGLVTGKDLAELCAANLSMPVRIVLWILAEVAIVATDLAELIGSAIAINLLFGLALPYGVAIMSLDVLIILLGWRKSTQRVFELAIAVLVVAVAICFIVLLTWAKPDWGAVFAGYVPTSTIFTNSDALYIAMGIVGATVMPHSIFLHSHLVINRTSTSLTSSLPKKTSRWASFWAMCGGGHSKPATDLPTVSQEQPPAATTQPQQQPYRFSMLGALRLYQIDTFGALTIALCINSAILIVAAATFFNLGIEVSSIQDAFYLMKEKLGPGAAYTFAVALFFSGQSSVITGTMAGQVVASGFLGTNSKIVMGLKPWIRRLITRLLAVVPAMCAAIIGGETAINRMLIGSQVALSIQLPFTVWPLVIFTSSKAIMKVWNDQSGKNWKRVKSEGSVEQMTPTDDEEMLNDEWDEDDDATVNSEVSSSRRSGTDVATVHTDRELDVVEGDGHASRAVSLDNETSASPVATQRRSVDVPLEPLHETSVETFPQADDQQPKPEAALNHEATVRMPKHKYVLDYRFVNSWPLKIVGFAIATVLTGLNVWLVIQVARGQTGGH